MVSYPTLRRSFLCSKNFWEDYLRLASATIFCLSALNSTRIIISLTLPSNFAATVLVWVTTMIVFWGRGVWRREKYPDIKKYRPQSYNCERYLGIFFCKLNTYELRQSFIAISLPDVKPDNPVLPDSVFGSPGIHLHSTHNR